MTAQPKYIPFQGGLDQESPAIAIPPGRLLAVQNYEAAPSGYRRTQGYERFDGRPSPAAATGATATARRAAITVVPGSGAVRGVLWYEGNLYAWRDNVGATAGVVHKSSSTGWGAVNIASVMTFADGGPYVIQDGDTITGATSGATAVVRTVASQADTSWEFGEAAGTLVLQSITGTFQADEQLNVGVNSFVATAVTIPTSMSFPPGGRYEFVIANFYGATGFQRAYGVNGVGNAFEFDGASAISIQTGMPDDRPFLIAEHKKHLFLGFPKGSLQNSALGEPRSFAATLGAAEIGFGKEITNIIGGTADSLIITTEGSFHALTGNDSSDFAKADISLNSGGFLHTAQNVGSVIYMDKSGIRSASTTQAYGGFKLGSYTSLIQKTIDAKIEVGVDPVASMVVKSKDQYLLFFDDGTGISLYFGRKAPEAMLFSYPFTVTCAHIGIDGKKERLFVGASNGFVYELNVGTSFDGANISSWAQVTLGHQGAPRVEKRYHHLIFEQDGGPNIDYIVHPEFDRSNGNQPLSDDVVAAMGGGAGIYTGTDFTGPGGSQAEAYIDGAGSDLNILLVCDHSDVDDHTIQGVTVMFSPRGARR